MDINIGRLAYSVRLSRHPLTGYSYLVDDDLMGVMICCEAPRERRLHLLAHAIASTWAEQVGRPASLEPADLADWFASVFASLHRDLVEQGGEPALRALHLGHRARRVPQLPVGPEGQRVCGHCGAMIAPGGVQTEAVEFDPRLQRRVASRGFACPTCDHVTTWLEAVNEMGHPNGEVMDNPSLLSGPEAVAWTRRNPGGTDVIYLS